MRIIVGQYAGFCYGVDRALRMAMETEPGEGHVYTWGEIVHNRQAIEALAGKRIVAADSLARIEPADSVVIRAHGVGEAVQRQLEATGATVRDATCPYVKKIHQLARRQEDAGDYLVVVGNPEHPEIIGILGWCGPDVTVIPSPEAAKTADIPVDRNISVFAQTTFVPERYEEVVNTLKKRFANVLKFDTICTATVRRQSEAAQLAEEADMMVVIGGKNSSNTQKLFSICQARCARTYLIETALELPKPDPAVQTIGITAGASTPEWVIKEVVQGMEDMNKTMDGEMSFSEAFEQTMTQLVPNSVVTGRIIGYNNNEVFVDLGYKADGIIPMDEFLEQPDFDPETDLKEGTEIAALIMKINDGDGNVQLSKKKVESIRGLEIMEEAFESRTPVEAVVKEVVKGGLVADFKGIRVFIPASQVSDRYVKDLSPYVGKTVSFIITELVRNKRRVVGSCRILIEETKAKLSEEFWGNIEIGKEYTGTVKSLTKFGAFVDLGAVDGLIHISELSWKKIQDPSEVLSIGDVVNVRILNFDPESKKLSLGYRRPEDNPWYDIDRKYQAGDIVAGNVIRIVPFGAFVELEPGVEGLVHISQISSVRIGRAEEVLHTGMNVEMKILEVNSELKKISLSIREVAPIDPPNAGTNEFTDAPTHEGYSNEHVEDLSNTIGDILGDQK
jgi:4-hydroxy-3-methylbut-2-enyl diphosphate reductase